MNSKHDTLDERFRQWSSARQCDEQGLRQLTTRIVDEACRRRRMHEAATPTNGVFALHRTGFAVIAAASLCAAVLFLTFRSHHRSAAPPNGGSQWARMSDLDATQDRRLFDELHRLFDERLRWVAEANGDISLGIDELAGGADADARPLAVRLVVVARDAGGSAWRPVWHGDVLLRADERVEVAAGKGGANRMTLWAHALANGHIALETALHLTAPILIASEVDAVFAEGVPTEVAALRSGNREYRVLQSVKML